MRDSLIGFLLGTVVAACVGFWSMNKQAQDFLAREAEIFTAGQQQAEDAYRQGGRASAEYFLSFCQMGATFSVGKDTYECVKVNGEDLNLNTLRAQRN